MKKLLFITALATTALAGCTSDEQNEAAKQSQPSKIVFNAPIVNGNTRTVAGPVEGKYNTKEKFRVFASYSESAFTTWSAGKEYLKNIEVAYNSELDDTETTQKGGWEPANKIYWPKNDNAKLTFAAYSPSDANSYNPTYGEKGLVITNFAVKDNVSDQYDLMYSERSYNKTKSKNELTGTGHTTGSYDGVDILFHHALSCIKFKIQTKEDYTSTTTIKVTGITILNAQQQATFNENIDETSSGYKSAPKWSNHTKTTDFVVYEDATGTTLSKNKIDIGSPALMIPQEMKGIHEIKIKINYTIQVTGGAEIPQVAEVSLVIGNKGTYFTDGTKSITAWEMGKCYTYTISIGLDNIIYFSPEVTNWDDITVSPDLTI